MATEIATRKPEDPLEVDPWPCWHPEGWEAAGECSMQLADGRTRGTARARFVEEDATLWSKVGVWKRYIVPVTRQEAWDDWGREHEADRGLGGTPLRDFPAAHAAAVEALPDVVPDDWDPGYCENKPVWRWVPRGTPGAIAYWVCGPAGSPPPVLTAGQKRGPGA